MRNNIGEGSTGVPFARLSAYLKAIGKLGESPELPVTELLAALEDVTHRQLMSDLDALGFSPSRALPRDQLARAVRKQIRKARIASQTAEVAPPDIPSVDSLLSDVRERVDDIQARRADAVETAYEYAVHQPELFLLGHGLFKREIVAHKEKEIVLYKHQIEEARRIVEQFLGSVIVVHEVGLGKTLTAISVLSELLLRDPGLTSLVIVPANLLKQWSGELSRCVDIPIYCGNVPKEVASRPHVLMAVDTAKEDRWGRILARRKWGLVIVDEGHILRHDHTIRYSFAYSLRSRYRILLTATPVHNSAYDVFHQVNIVRPGLLGRKAVFADTHMSGERRVSDPVILQERLTKAVSRMRRDETGLPFPSRDIDHVLVDNRSQLEQQLYNDVLTVLRGIYRRHLDSTAFLRRPSGKEEGVPQIVLVAVLVLRELASHPLAAIKTLSRPLVRRAQHLARVTGDTTDLDALDRILNQYSRERWQEGSHSKTDSLITQLPELVGNYGRVIVYVEFRETQKVIVERLQRKRQVGLPTKTDVISYHGGLTLAEKSHQIDRFNSHQHACLVSTDAGGQGLNLQEGNVVVNFDFPWNPMRVEQRIGRVDRMGQKASRIVVRNFITIDTIEQYVYQTLREKLRVCEDVLGHLVPPIFRLRRIEDRYSSQDDVLGIGHIILSSENDVDLRQKFLALGSELDEQLSRREAVWRPPPRWIDG